MKRFSLKNVNLLVQILVALGLGIAVGQFVPLWLARPFATFNAIFSQFLGFLIPLLIIGFVAPAIAEVGNKAGKVLLLTVALAYLSTTAAGMMGFFVGDSVDPSLISVRESADALTSSEVTIEPYFAVNMPPMMEVMTALVLAFLLGIWMATLYAPTL